MPSLSKGMKIQANYRVIKLIGEGGMNRVYLVETIDGRQRFALKVTKEQSEVQSSQQEIYNQFLKEISVLTTLSHPAIPHVQEYFTMGTSYCIVEEYIGGISLERYLEKNKPTERDVVAWALTLCSVLELLHKNGLIFRDMKPANVVKTKKGDIKLIDFDIARHYKKGKLIDTTLLGTPGYAAPETYGKAQSDARSDVYSLGATMHHLLSGVDPQDHPFQFEPLEKLRPGISKSLAQVVEKALQNMPEKRFRTVAELKKALQAVQAKLPPLPAPSPAGRSRHQGAKASSPPGKSNPDGWVGVFVLLIIVLFFSMCVVHQYRDHKVILSTDRIVVTKLFSPPLFQVSEVWDRSYLGRGDSLVLYRDTYAYYPDDVAGPYVDLNPQVIHDDSAVNACIKFSVRNDITRNSSLAHTLSVLFVMPVKGDYSEGKGSFAIIPGRYGDCAVEAPMKWEMNENVIRSVVTEPATVKVTFTWMPLVGKETMRVPDYGRKLGPRMLVNLRTDQYSWQYTTGFAKVR
jgi:serine/threonine protein kinase